MIAKPGFDHLPDVLTPREAAKVLRVGKNSIYEAIHRGEVRSFKLGGKLLIPKAAILELVLGDQPSEEPEAEEPGARYERGHRIRRRHRG